MLEMTDLVIDKQIEEIDKEIELLANEGTLEQELIEFDKPTFKELSELQLKEDEIVKELEELKQLWVVANFIKEIEFNLEMYELESVALSMEKLSSKISMLIDQQVKAMALEKLNELKDEFNNVLSNVWEKLLVIGENELIFNAEVEIDGNSIQYQTFIDLIHERKLLNLNVSKTLDDLLITKLVSNNYVFALDDNKILITETSNNSIDSIIQSIVSIINFISQFPDNLKIIHYITTRFYDWLKKIIIDNVELIYNNQKLKDDFLNLNEFLISHGFKRDDLKTWIDSELNSFIIEYYLATHIDDVRKYFKTLNESDFNDAVKRSKNASFTPFQETTSTVKSTPKTTSKPISKQEPIESDDGWDAWGDDDMEFEDDNDEPPVEETSDKEDNDNWDAWNDDEDEEPSQPSKLVSKLSKNSQSRTPTPTLQNKKNLTKPISQLSASTTTNEDYITTSIPESTIPIFESFITKRSKIPQSYTSTFETKLDELITAYYMISLESYKNKFLLYNDLQHLSQELNLLKLHELSESLLTESVKAKESSIFELFTKLNNLNPSLNSTVTFNIILDIDIQFNEFKEEIYYLSTPLKNMILIASVDAVYQLIINSILERLSIGEDESEYLSIVITKFLELSIIQDLDHNKIPNYSKIIHIQYILKNHLADIMNSFYNAEFFDLSTMELISLIDKLFADSDLKRRNIQEIREIRETD